MENRTVEHNTIIDELDQPVYIADIHTYEMLYMNKACMRLLGCSDYLGQPCYKIAQGLDAPCPFCTSSKLKSGQVLRWEHRNDMLGKTYQLEDSLINYEGHLARMEVVFDVSSHVTRETEMQTVLESERQLVSAIQTVSGAGTISECVDQSLKICGKFFQADRTYVFEINEENTLDNLYEWCNTGVEPQIELLQHVDIHYMDRWLTYFEKQQAVVTPDIEEIRDSRPDEYQIMIGQGIHSYIEAPLYSGGKLIGFLGVDNPNAEKMQHSSDLLLSFAYSVGNAMIRAQNEQKIQYQFNELESVVSNIPVGVSMIRVRDGKPVYKKINPLLCELYGISPDEADRADEIVVSRLTDADRKNMLEKMHSLLTPGTAITYDFRYPQKAGEPPRWYQMRSRSVATGDELLLFSCLFDRTAEREAQEKSIQSQKINEMAVELANLKMWVYDVKNHRIILSDNANTVKDADTYGMPMVFENVPESVLEFVEEPDHQKMRDMYRALDEGAPSYDCEYHYKSIDGIPDYWTHIRYVMTYDESGAPALAYAIGMDITAQVQERERYRQSIRSLMSSNPDAIGTYRMNLTKNAMLGGESPDPFISSALNVNTADAFFERAASLIIGDRCRQEYLFRFNRQSLLTAIEDGKTNFSIEYRSCHGEDKKPWVRAHFVLIRNPDTGDVECVTYALDISRQKQNDAIFNRITEQEYDFVALLHLPGETIEFLKVNPALPVRYQEALGHTEVLHNFDEIRCLTADSWIAREDRQFYLDNSGISVVRERLDRDGHFEMIIRGHTAAHPEETMCRKIQHYYLDDDKDTVLIIQSDVTETYLQQQKEAAMAKAETRRVEDIIDSVGTGICVFRMPDADHLEGEFVNLQMFRILGLTPPDCPNARQKMLNDPVVARYMRNAFCAVHPDDLERVKKAFHDGFVTTYFNAGNYRIIKTDGSAVWINQNSILREVRPDGHIFYAAYRVVDHEVELQKELEQQLQKEKLLRDQADMANAAKSDFLSRMSHDIRTPLNGIIGMTYLTQAMELPPQARENLEKIDLSSKFLLSLINEVLDMSKAESGNIELHPEPYDSAEFFRYLQSVVLPLCMEKNIEFVVDAEPVTEVLPLIDKLRINQVFFNLLSNAVKFTPEGGKVTYRLKEHLTGEGRLVLEAEVSDTGIGMSEQFQKHLFEPFTQERRNDNSNTRGTGLGLAIAKKLLDLMGCKITVHSELGKGTAFYLRGEFDCVQASQPAKGPEPIDSFACLEGCHVLLCEDHPLNQEIAKTLLNKKKVIVTIAEDGRRGLQEFSNSLLGYYDAVLMDVRMPVMDGIEAARAIRALNRPDAKTVPILAMTADAFAEDVQKCLDAGMNAHIAKPVDPQNLYYTLADVIAPK